MKIYTKTGDAGTTGLLGAGRVEKDDPRIESYGTVDELNAVLGVARASGIGTELDRILGPIQEELFAVGTALADPDPDGRFHNAVGERHVARLEQFIDQSEETLPGLTQFILPGGSAAAAQIHLARTVCRRAERQVVRLSHTPGELVPPALIIYLNRLSDLLFVLARKANQEAGRPDVPWSGL